MEQFGDKEHDATPHRRQQARERGEVARSHDLASALVLLGTLWVVWNWGLPLVEFLGHLGRESWGGSAWLTADADWAAETWTRTLGGLGAALGPVLGVALVVGVVANLAQVGFLFVPEKLQPDVSRLDPLAAAGRMFAVPNLVRLAMGLLKLAIVAAVAWWALADRLDDVLALMGYDVGPIGYFTLDLLYWTSLKIAAALVVLALLDYAYQWYRHEQDLRMTTQELREEMRNLQGDPQIVARRRQVQRQMVFNRLSTTVPKADVVVTNPTELAVALQYDVDTMSTPVVVAKGAGALAQRIRRLALEHGIPIIEKKPLAQALYKLVEVNQPIPREQYTAVAEILAYVYRLKGKKVPGGRRAA